MALDVTALISELLPMLHADSLANLTHWSDAQLTRAFRDYLFRHAQRLGVFVKRDQITVDFVSGTAQYPAPPNTVDIMHVAFEGVPLIPSTTAELEALDDSFRSTAATLTNPVSRWYVDKQGANQISFYPVPAAGGTADVIYHEYPCDLDEAHTEVDIDVQPVIGVLLKLQVLGESYSLESDSTMPETAKAARAMAGLIEQATAGYYGAAQ